MIPPLDKPWLESGETLVCFGDSLTSSKTGYVQMLADALAPKGIRVINAGLGGDKTPQALSRLMTDVIAQKPDAISLFFGANDAEIGRGRWRDEPVVEPVTYRDNLVWMVHLCRLNSSIRKFSIAAPSGRIEGASWNEFGDVRREYCLMARQAADLANAVFVPVDTVLDSARDSVRASENGLKLTTDGIHPTPEGYRLIADNMLKTWSMN